MAIRVSMVRQKPVHEMAVDMIRRSWTLPLVMVSSLMDCELFGGCLLMCGLTDKWGIKIGEKDQLQMHVYRNEMGKSTLGDAVPFYHRPGSLGGWGWGVSHMMCQNMK
jgi:hypothetical protein